MVVGHGNLAHCLTETAESIAGVTGALIPISNAGCSPDVLCDRIRDAVGTGPAIVFVDLASGSCAHAAITVGRDVPAMAVITGANLSMLLDYLFHRDMDVASLSERLLNKGQSGMNVFAPDRGE